MILGAGYGASRCRRNTEDDHTMHTAVGYHQPPSHFGRKQSVSLFPEETDSTITCQYTRIQHFGVAMWCLCRGAEDARWWQDARGSIGPLDVLVQQTGVYDHFAFDEGHVEPVGTARRGSIQILTIHVVM